MIPVYWGKISFTLSCTCPRTGAGKCTGLPFFFFFFVCLFFGVGWVGGWGGGGGGGGGGLNPHHLKFTKK